MAIVISQIEAYVVWRHVISPIDDGYRGCSIAALTCDCSGLGGVVPLWPIVQEENRIQQWTRLLFLALLGF